MTLGEQGVPGRGPNNFSRPTDIAFLPDGTFFISDGYDGKRVAKFDPDGNSEYIAIDDKLVSKYTNATSFNISFKTSGTGGQAWTALKGIYKEEMVNLDDIIAEKITAKHARDIYGVAADPRRRSIDWDDTRRLRS